MNHCRQTRLVTDEFKGNSKYLPSPRSLGIPEPTDSVDAAIRLAATGYGPERGIRQALVESSVFLAPESAIDLGGLLTAAGGRRVLGVFTDVRHAPSSIPELRKVDAVVLAASLPTDAYLKLNHGSFASVEVPVTDLLR
ncbi:MULTISPECIES: hypothetical protein [unclassified Streptomyces]|uniref:hypothetical protein n=1 Tax=unclassified Streptomyces TaxID=2593676 RepID=UPI003818C496